MRGMHSMNRNRKAYSVTKYSFGFSYLENEILPHTFKNEPYFKETERLELREFFCERGIYGTDMAGRVQFRNIGGTYFYPHVLTMLKIGFFQHHCKT